MRPLRRRVCVDGHVFRLITSPHSAAEAPVIVLLHGIGMSHRYLARLHRALVPSAHVVSVDLPGFGGLPRPRDDLGIPRMVDLLRRALPAAVNGPVVLVGHSMGAQWAVEIAIRHPDLARLVVAIGPVADEAHRTLRAQAVGLATDTLGESPVTNAIVFSDYLRAGIRWYLAQARHMLRYPLEERVAALEAPLLIVRGGRDPIAGRDWCGRLRDRASGARLVEIPRARHVAQRSAPGAVADAILAHTDSAVKVGNG